MKSIFHHFEGLSAARNCLRPERSPLISPQLISSTPMFCLAHFLSALKLKGDSNIKIFAENQPPAKNNQINSFITARAMKCLPPKIGS